MLLTAGMVLAQETETKKETKKKCQIEGVFATDIVSQYIWRGADCGSLSVQPTLGIGWKGLSLTAWGNVGVSNFNDTKEFDLTLAYTIKGFNIGITDYWFSSGANPDGKYFAYSSHSTNHVFEANVGYDFKYVSLQWYTNFCGNDGVNNSGKRAYSSYFEIAAPFRLIKCDWEAAVGCVPYASSYYGTSGFNVTNVSLKATKTFSVHKKIDIPVYANIIANPCTKKAYFVVGAQFDLKL